MDTAKAFAEMQPHTICFVILSVILAQASAAPSFTAEPEDVVRTQGQTAIFHCKVENLGQAAVQWMKDGFGLGEVRGEEGRDLPDWPRYTVIGSGQLGEYDLMISNTRLEDDSNFECQVMASAGVNAIKTKKGRLTVQVPPDTPTVEGGPSVKVVSGQAFNLTCHARNGSPAPNITWYAEGNLITDQAAFSVTEDAKRKHASSYLTINPRKSDQGKNYKCTAQNAALMEPKYTSVSLNVQYAPEVTMTVNPTKELSEYSGIDFACEALGNPSVIEWKWYIGGDLVGGQTSSRLSLASVERDRHGKAVECEASNVVGKTRQSYTLNIIFGPRFKAPPEHVAVNLGDDASLRCNPDGNPAPAIIWRRADSVKIWGSNAVLKIADITESKLGVYKCTASSLGFPDITQEVHLMKNDAPSVISPSSQNARFGDTGVITCKVRSVPKPEKITWNKNGEPLDLTTLKRYQVREEDLPFGKRSLIEITSVQDGDYGDYNCSVENGYGHDALVIQFSKKEVIPLAFILAGVLGGCIIIVIIAIILFIYHRRRAMGGSESGSESSEESIAKKKELPMEPKIEYSGDVYGSPIDAWRQENADPKYYRHSAEYDELSYPPKDNRNGIYGISPAPAPVPAPGPAPYGYDDYDNYGYQPRDYPRNPNPYGTFPGRVPNNRVYDTRPPYEGSVHGSAYGGSEYGTYNRAPPRMDPRMDFPSNSSDYGPAELNSRLSTNV